MKQSVLLIFLLCLESFCEKAWARPSFEGDPDEDDLMINDADDDTDDDLGGAPVILSKGQNFTVTAGETIRLPCDIENIDNAVVQWRRNFSDALFFDETKQLQEPRYTLSKAQTLTIENVSSVDDTSFSCQLLDENEQIITHWVSVKENEVNSQIEQRGQGMPRVIRVFPEEPKIFKKNEPFTIMCEVGGYPKPTISWSHKGKPLKESEGKDAIHIDFATRKHTGKYVCTATNQNGQDSRSAEIQVVYSPEIEMSNEPIIAGEGYESEIICNVHSNPPAEVWWYKGSEKLNSTHHINILQEGHKKILRISGTRKSDYGTYTCFAINSIGNSTGTVELTGKPGKPVFENSSYSEDSISSPVLSWIVRSYKAIDEFEVLYKKQHVDDWITVTLDESSRSVTPPLDFVYSHTFKDLEPGTYEAKVRAKNIYGWSDYSDKHTFAGKATMNEGSGVSCLELSRIALVFLLSLIIGNYLQ
ncbi:limbic system-associated membrane protein-like isoform X3 [Rhodnius prolixus]|uniref:limbic system-associated membrane protein-like isoform X3 n=1 Tax=Rhodnius prolixus TaxID=13249 RepID=UPI003D187C14